MHTAIRLLRWLIGAPLWALGVWIISCNWRLLVLFIRGRSFGRHPPDESALPLAGPLILCLGALVVPVSGLLPYSWLALPIDPATYMLIASLPFLFRDLIWSSRKKST